MTSFGFVFLKNENAPALVPGNTQKERTPQGSGRPRARPGAPQTPRVIQTPEVTERPRRPGRGRRSPGLLGLTAGGLED